MKSQYISIGLLMLFFLIIFFLISSFDIFILIFFSVFTILTILTCLSRPDLAPYILKRIFIFIPTLFIVSILAFYITHNSPHDPIENKLNSMSGSLSQHTAILEEQNKLREQMGLDLPLFYFNLTTQADTDTLNRIPHKLHRQHLDHLIHIYGNWEAISNYYLAVQNNLNVIQNWTTDQFKPGQQEIINIHQQLLTSSYGKKLTADIDKLRSLYRKIQLESSSFNNLLASYQHLESNSNTWQCYIPDFHWHGSSNQYHRWLFGTRAWFSKDTSGTGGLLRGDFGVSYLNGHSVNINLLKKFKLSLELVLLSVLLAYFISLPIGIYAAYKRNSIFDKVSGVILFMLYSLPVFFVGLLLLNYFANPDHYQWFYATSYKPSEITERTYYQLSYPERMKISWPYMVLPVITYTYTSFAFISRIMRAGMVNELDRDYIQTARAKGLSERKVILKHAFKNSLLPVITIFSDIFPMAIGGSVIIEFIFNYKGMGYLTLQAIRSGDQPVIIAVFIVAALLTMFAYLLADILYALVDPRIDHNRKI